MGRTVNFAISLLFFWVKGSVFVDDRFVKVNRGNTILGFIPAGKDAQTIPLKNISSAQLTSKYKVFPMLIGGIFILIALSIIGNSFFAGLIFLLIGVGIFGSGTLTTLIIQRAGSDYTVSVPFFEKNKMAQVQDMIDEALVVDTDKTDLSKYMDKKE